MNEGVFAFIDCLGWRGIWQKLENHDPSHLIERLKEIQKTVENWKQPNDQNADIMGQMRVKREVCLLSDTVAISLTFDRPAKEKIEGWEKGNLISWMTLMVVDIITLFLNADPPLTMRGCITYGPHRSEGNFIVGKAVDEAAEYEKLADGAFIWLHPKLTPLFNEFLDEWVKRAIKEGYVVASNEEGLSEEDLDIKLHETTRKIFSATFIDLNYKMPLKDGRYLECPVVNPFIKCNSEDERQKMTGRYLKAMNDDRLDVILKRTNTKAMLNDANETIKTMMKIKEPPK